MPIAYWVVAGLLAAFYLYAGGKKVVQSREQLAPMMAWAGTTIPMSGVRAIGVVEILGALGLILPPATGIAPVLAPAAAVGLLLLQILATLFHLRRRETTNLPLNLALIVITVAVVWLGTAG